MVEINGAISSGRNRADILFGDVVTGSDEVSYIFDQLSKPPFLHGVIIRVNSPGGSVLATDQILMQLMNLKKCQIHLFISLWGHLLLQVNIMLRLDLIAFLLMVRLSQAL